MSGQRPPLMPRGSQIALGLCYDQKGGVAMFLAGRQASKQRAMEYRRDVAELGASKVLREKQCQLVEQTASLFSKSMEAGCRHPEVVRLAGAHAELLVDTIGTALLSGDLQALEDGYLYYLPAETAAFQSAGVSSYEFGQLVRAILDEIRELFDANSLQGKSVERMLQHIEKHLTG